MHILHLRRKVGARGWELVVSGLETLLEIQEHDTTIDRLRHRHKALESRAAYQAAAAATKELTERHGAVVARRDEVAQAVQRLDDEATLVKEHAARVEKTLYSGEVASPRELQALQADLDQIRRQQRGIEDRELEAMELRDTVDAERIAVEKELTDADAELERLGRVLADEEAVIDAELAGVQAARDGLAAVLDAQLLQLYERCRARARGVGAARLVGSSCQGCHLTIPATEVDRIKKAPAGAIAHCDNCGAILVA